MLFNVFLARKLPILESCILVIHVFAFFGIIVALWVLSARLDARTVFTGFSDGGGWGSLGASTLAGITTGIFPLLGVDCAVHMSEELRSASRSIPRSIVWTTVLNGVFAWVMIISLTFCIGPGNLSEILASPTGFPFMAVFLNSTKSTASATALAVWVVLMSKSSNFSVSFLPPMLWEISSHLGGREEHPLSLYYAFRIYYDFKSLSLFFFFSYLPSVQY